MASCAFSSLHADSIRFAHTNQIQKHCLQMLICFAVIGRRTLGFDLPSQDGAQELVVGVLGAFLVGGQRGALPAMRVASEVDNIRLRERKSANLYHHQQKETQGEANQEEEGQELAATLLAFISAEAGRCSSERPQISRRTGARRGGARGLLFTEECMPLRISFS